MAGHPLNLYMLYMCNRTGRTRHTQNDTVQYNFYSILEIDETMYLLLKKNLRTSQNTQIDQCIQSILCNLF